MASSTKIRELYTRNAEHHYPRATQAGKLNTRPYKALHITSTTHTSSEVCNKRSPDCDYVDICRSFPCLGLTLGKPYDPCGH
jgi:hypothetical protein